MYLFVMRSMKNYNIICFPSPLSHFLISEEYRKFYKELKNSVEPVYIYSNKKEAKMF